MTITKTLATPVLRVVPAAVHRLVARTLARAFAEDPVSRYMSDKPERDEPGFDLLARLPNNGVYATAGGDAVACWLPPGKAHMGLLQQLRMLPGLAAAARGDLPRMLSAIGAMEKGHPHEPHWYLNMLAVSPAAQGRGLGPALLAHRLERCDEEGLPAYLNATTERGVPLYERHGFAVVEEFHLPKGGPPLWRMWRDPQPR